jgi:hypothetical protein
MSSESRVFPRNWNDIPHRGVVPSPGNVGVSLGLRHFLGKVGTNAYHTHVESERVGRRGRSVLHLSLREIRKQRIRLPVRSLPLVMQRVPCFRCNRAEFAAITAKE